MGERADTRGWRSGYPNCHPANIVTVTLSTGARLPVHHAIAELVKLICEECIRNGFVIRAGASWGYACRSIRGSTAPSNHSWGLAVDLNAPDHPLGRRNTGMPAFVPALFKRFGFRWGGDYTGRADEMHFEYMGTPATAAQHTAAARSQIAAPGHQPVPVPAPPEDDDMPIIISNRNDAEQIVVVAGLVLLLDNDEAQSWAHAGAKFATVSRVRFDALKSRAVA